MSPVRLATLNSRATQRAAVLSNGDTPDYFVGHVDEFNYDWIWHQNLLLPPGSIT